MFDEDTLFEHPDGSVVEFEKFSPAKWYDLVYDATGEQKGKVLLAFGIMSLEQAKNQPLEDYDIFPSHIPC